MMYQQLSIRDVLTRDTLSNQPGRVAYIDESGSFGFDFNQSGTSKYYILTAVVVDVDKIEAIHNQLEEIKKNNGYGNTELKSSRIPDAKRKRIMAQLLPLDFSLVVFIADKELMIKGTPLTEYKKTFVKNMNNRMYMMLYKAYPKLKIFMDETGYPEFQESFKQYVESQRSQLNIFNEYDFDFIDSKDETIIQIADFISGSFSRYLLDPETTPNYMEMLRGKITALKRFPQEIEPFWGRVDPADLKYDDTVFMLSVKTAEDFIAKYSDDSSDERKAQIAVLEYLLLYVMEINPTEYVYADELVRHIQPYINKRPTKDFLYRNVIAPLRDSGVLLASCVHGYKIPISVEDIKTYLNQTTSVIGPMLSRMGLCRDLVLQGTGNSLDVFNDEAYIRYKRFFE